MIAPSVSLLQQVPAHALVLVCCSVTGDQKRKAVEEADSLRAKLDAVAAERDAAQAALKELNESFAKLVSEKDATAADNSQLSQKAAALEAELAAAKEKLAGAGAELAQAQKKAAAAQGLADQRAAQIAQLTDKARLLASESTRMSAELDEKRRALQAQLAAAAAVIAGANTGGAIKPKESSRDLSAGKEAQARVEEPHSAAVKGKPQAASEVEMKEAKRKQDAPAAELMQLRGAVKDLEAQLAASSAAREAAEEQLPSAKSAPAAQNSGKAPLAKELKPEVHTGPTGAAADITALAAARDEAVAAREELQRKLQAEETAAGQLRQQLQELRAAEQSTRKTIAELRGKLASMQPAAPAAPAAAPRELPKEKKTAGASPGVGQAALIALASSLYVGGAGATAKAPPSSGLAATPVLAAAHGARASDEALNKCDTLCTRKLRCDLIDRQ